MTATICPVHNVELVFIGQMSDIDDGMACPFCMNDLENECLHAHEGGCSGEISVVFGISGIAMAMCNAHEMKMYQRR